MPKIGVPLHHAPLLFVAGGQHADGQRTHALGFQLPDHGIAPPELGLLERARIAQPLEVGEGIERGHGQGEQPEQHGLNHLAPGADIHLIDQVLHARLKLKRHGVTFFLS